MNDFPYSSLLKMLNQSSAVISEIMFFDIFIIWVKHWTQLGNWRANIHHETHNYVKETLAFWDWVFMMTCDLQVYSE